MRKKFLFVTTYFLTFVLISCSSGSGGPIDTISEMEIEEKEIESEAECSSDSDCNDGFDCTIDSCAIGGVCSHIPINSLCAEGERCDVEKGCIAVGCTSNEECSDSIDCTQDICGAGGECQNIPVNQNCQPGETCSPTLGCIALCIDSSECQNGIFCDGEEKCSPEFGCLPGDPRDCNDNDPCTEDSCDTTLDACVNKCIPSETCTCPFLPEDAYNACYSISPPVQEFCSMPRFNFTVSQVCFTLTGLALQAIATPFRGGAGANFSQIFTGSAGPEFDVSYIISGGCEEQYRISGTFSDNEHFDGTFTANFIDHDGFSCALGGCPNQSFLISGTKIP